MKPDFPIFGVDTIDARVVALDWPFAREEARFISDNWRRLIAVTPAMFDGRVLLMADGDIATSGGARVLECRFFETRFSAFLGWRDRGFPAGARNCFAQAALRGADGGFVLGEMGAHTSNAGQIYFASGTPEPNDVVGDRLDLDGSVTRELAEETGLARDEVAFGAGWTLVDAGPKLACLKTVRVATPAAELAREIDARLARQSQPEFARMHVVASAADIDASRMPPFIVAYLARAFATSRADNRGDGAKP